MHLVQPPITMHQQLSFNAVGVERLVADGSKATYRNGIWHNDDLFTRCVQADYCDSMNGTVHLMHDCGPRDIHIRMKILLPYYPEVIILANTSS